MASKISVIIQQVTKTENRPSEGCVLDKFIPSASSNSHGRDRLQSGEMSHSVPFVSLPSTCSLKSLFKARGGWLSCRQVWVAHFVCKLLIHGLCQCSVFLCPSLITLCICIYMQIPTKVCARCCAYA